MQLSNQLITWLQRNALTNHVDTGQELHIMFTSNNRMRKKVCGMAVGTRRAGLNISFTADLLGFSPKQSVEFTQNG